ncbi:hypothetical protein [Epibacterium ulvae]|uniref:hypothetical protein n=1 Tax=Epibacterium ulvae TaxID=1156985 RepID=UPI00111335C1|nr:hypothetical protein [Epibacterium ulvae]
MAPEHCQADRLDLKIWDRRYAPVPFGTLDGAANRARVPHSQRDPVPASRFVNFLQVNLARPARDLII